MQQTEYTTFYIARHGQTEANIKHIINGHSDSDLTAEGERQAKHLGKLLEPVAFDHIFSSDLIRAKRTAEIATIERKLTINTTKLLRERFFGAQEGISYEEFHKRNKELFDKLETLSDQEQWTVPWNDGAENEQDLITRMLTFIREYAVTYPGKTILTVTHGGLIRALLVHLGWGTFNEIEPDAIKNTCYVKIKTDGIDFFIDHIHDIVKS